MRELRRVGKAHRHRSRRRSLARAPPDDRRAGCTGDRRARSSAAATQLAAFDFPNGSLVLTEAGSKRRASLHVIRGEDALRAVDPGGIDVFGADLDAFRRALSVENRTLKRALTDPRIVSGIGNAYSDEILHAAQLSPVALTAQAHARQNGSGCSTATRATLQLMDRSLRSRGRRRTSPKHVTAFRNDMAVHGRFGQPCPLCGEPVQRIRFADNETNYCARCQTGGTAPRRPQPLAPAGCRLAAHARRAGERQTLKAKRP